MKPTRSAPKSNDESQIQPPQTSVSTHAAVAWAIGSAVVGAIAGVYGEYHTMLSTVESRAREAVMETQFVSELSRRVRPFMVIDALGVIRSDHGAAALIARTGFTVRTNVPDIEMTVSLKEHHETAPIVRSMTGHLYVHEVKRGTGHDWIFSLRPGAVAYGPAGATTFAAYGVALIPEYYFLVEVLP